MKKENKKYTIGIIAAQISDDQQKHLLEGVAEEAKELNINIAVLSNVYNPYYYDTQVEIENNIYNLVFTDKIDAIIVDVESVLNDELKQHITDIINKAKKDIPVVTVCQELADAEYLDNDVVEDFTNITNHLIEHHGFTDIDILTGFENVETSKLRVEGCKKAFEAHNIPFDKDRVIYGDYWLFSGEALAKDYVYGKRKLPQALICTNDYMAFGLCDELMKHDIKIPDDITVIGYEYVGERYHHFPLLTSYSRNRKAVGKNAVRRIYSLLTGEEYNPVSTKGELVLGNSCSCGADKKYLRNELENKRDQEFYIRLNLIGTFGLKLTLCTSIEEFIGILQQYAYQIRNINSIYLCLYDDWCNSELTNSGDKKLSETMICYPIINLYKTHEGPIFYNKSEFFPDAYLSNEESELMYFMPLFFGNKEFGYIALTFENAGVFDLIFISWLKTASNSLEFLRMKNDINYLVKCQNLSEYHDTTSGLYNEQGIRKQLKMKLVNASESDRVMMLILRTSLFSGEIDFNQHENILSIEISIADFLKKLTAKNNELCAKIDNNTYLIAGVGEYPDEAVNALIDVMNTLVTHLPGYISHCGLSSFACSAETFGTENFSFSQTLEKLRNKLSADISELTTKQQQQNYASYSKLRNELYSHPESDLDLNQVCQRFCLSTGHFRVIYKEIFGISFHQDTIRSRLSYAKYLLLTSSMSVSAIAMKCGYDDEKYFMRQFRQFASYTPNQYRNNFSI